MLQWNNTEDHDKDADVEDDVDDAEELPDILDALTGMDATRQPRWGILKSKS
jgi:hypothetical protein